MTRSGFLAAVPVLAALCVPAVAQPQSPYPAASYPPPAQMQPPQPQGAPVSLSTNPATGETVETSLTPPAPNPPPTEPKLMPSVPTPGFVWVPGHYNWDPNQHQYVWLVGQYVQPPHSDMRWVAGNWQLDGPNWVWIDGHFE